MDRSISTHDRAPVLEGERPDDIHVALFERSRKAFGTSAILWSIFGGLASAALSTILSAVIVFGAAPSIGGPRATVGQSLSQAFVRFWPYVGLTVLVYLIANTVPTPVIVAVVFVAMARRWPTSGAPDTSHTPNANPFLFDPQKLDIDLAAWAVLGVVPLIALVYAFMLPSTRALMAGRFGVTGSMAESWRLTRGSRFRIWAFLVPPMLASGVGAVALLSIESERTRAILTVALQALVATPFMACAAAASYDQLKARKGGGAATIAKVFE